MLTKSSNCMERQENVHYTKLNGGGPVRYGSNSQPTSLVTSTASLTSSDCSLSSCSDFSVDAYSYGRGYQEDSSFSLEGQLRDSSLPAHVNEIHQSNKVMKTNVEERNNVNNRCIGADSEILVNGYGRTRDNGVERVSLAIDDEIGTHHPYNDEMDAQFWLPPEPEDQENDIEGSVANYEEDDDECGDGMKWGKPSSLSSFGEEGSGSYRFKEGKQKAMDEVMNGKFKALVGQLLKSVGVADGGKDDDNWVDIVTSLSWEAASFVKPDTVEGKAMDPDGYVKIKCIATGCRSQSHVFKGLVFKKHAAHKHMPTKYKNPRLLLIQGAVDLSSSGLSSFESMKQEKDSLNSIIEMIERCHPNVVLVEKSVSRDIQESILAKGMTLVFDMKLHRLERVGRCIGSTILSSDVLTGQKLKQCDSFHFEKFLEEHNTVGEGGKRPSKTLMFLEGCPTRLGCTILLKGTHSDELKRIKCVVQYAVLVAYHLILETSFLLDQSAMFSTIPLYGLMHVSLYDQQPSVHCPQESSAETDLSLAIDVPISNGFHEEGSLSTRLEGDSTLSYEPYNPVIFSGFSSLSASLKKAIGDSFPLLSTSQQSISTYFGFNGRDPNGNIQTSIEISSSPEATDHCDMETKGSSDEEKTFNNEPPHSSSVYSEAPLDTQKYGCSDEDQKHYKDDISTVLDSESILVLLSRRNASRGTICEQSHFSHIKFYRNFDVPLGKFLLDNLLNQKVLCNTCEEPPENHFYYYAHHNKQLTIQIKHLPMDMRLPGETEGKLWMWSCCAKCKHYNGKSKSTRRVLMSNAARDFSFGKFLELSLSNHSSFSRPSSCGHFFHRDFHYFFGLGPMVAMFRYSPVATYSVSLPPQKLEFGNSFRGELLKEYFGNVHAKGDLMFLEVEKSLKEIGSRFAGLTLNLQGSVKEFSDIVEMLKQERYQFEVEIENIAKNGDPDEAVYKLVSLNRVQWELLLESCLWDLRLYLLLSPYVTVTDIGTTVKLRQGETYLKEAEAAGEEADAAEIMVESGDEVFNNFTDLKMNVEISAKINDSPIKEIPIEGKVQGYREQDESSVSFIVTEDIGKSNVGRVNENGSSPSVHSHAGDENCAEDNLPSSSQLGKIIPITKDLGRGALDSNPSLRGKSPFSLLSNLENSKGWIWTPFPEIRRDFMQDLQRGYSPKFEPINSHTRGSRVHDLITEEGSKLHIPLGTDDYIVSDYEDELSSIIACALALLKDVPIVTEDFSEDIWREKGIDAKAYDNSHSLTRISSSLASPHWSSFGSLDLDGIDSSTSISSEESHMSSSHGLYLLDSLASLRAPHPEVSMGLRKYPGKSKYSVVCLYASQFRDLRNQCCTSELAYIASLSRCRNWDAKGGKSKSFFAKTRDERFIIKEIKRIEFESFMKFASDYFGYMNQCFELGNQTCLAKILGIYQVREIKSGKETKHDLMVMENLTFCRHITRQYDLKGALHARFNSAADGSGGDVLLDQNFVNDMNVSPLYISRTAKRNLQRAVWNDTTFLNSINVMDYSLLVGVDTRRRELVCGIIDYLRQYTWDKQLENWVKSSLVVPKNQLPTVISPKEYKKRFRKFITAHFLSVPDNWCSQRNGDSSQTKSQEQGDHHQLDDYSHPKSQEQGKQNDFSS